MKNNKDALENLRGKCQQNSDYPVKIINKSYFKGEKMSAIIGNMDS